MTADGTAADTAGGLLHDALEASPCAVVGVDARGRIILANAQALRYFGYAREELLGESVEMLLPRRHREAHGAHRREFTARPSSRPMGANRILTARRKDGSEFPAEIGLGAIPTRDGLASVAIVVDVSDRVRAEEATRRAEAHARQAGRMEAVGRLAGGMTHDFESLLTAIESHGERRRDARDERTLRLREDRARPPGDEGALHVRERGPVGAAAEAGRDGPPLPGQALLARRVDRSAAPRARATGSVGPGPDRRGRATCHPCRLPSGTVHPVSKRDRLPSTRKRWPATTPRSRGSTMRNLPVLLVVLSLSVPAGADEITESLERTLELYKAGKIKDALEEVDYAATKMRESRVSDLGQYLPEAPSGWSRTVEADESGSVNVLGGNAMMTKATYTSPEGQRATVQIMGGSLAQGMGSAMGLATMFGGGGNTKTRVKGHTAMQTTSGDQITLMFNLDNGLLVNIEGKGFPSADPLKELAAKMDLDGLEAI